MAHDTTLSAPVGTGDTIATVDLGLGTYPTGSGKKLPASCLYLSVDASTAPTPLTAANALYVQPGSGASFAVTGTFWQATQPVSAASLPLPSGASTAAKQPALGTAGSASADVISIQGVASMTPVKVDGSGVTQPVSGTVAVSGSVAVTGTFWQTTQPVSGTVTANAGSGTFTISGAVTNAGTFAVQAAQSGTWTVQPGNTPNTTPWLVSDQAAVAGGTSIYSFLSTSAVQAAAVKASAGQVYALHFFNINATPVYVRLYNQTTTPGTGDTVVYRAIVPGNTAGAGYVVAIPPGVVFTTGIGVRVTNAIADNDSTALAANTVAGNVFYK